MPLSEHEQRLLAQMEQALYAEDPKFASSLRGADPRTHHRRRVVKASLGFVAGIALLLAGVISPNLLVSIVGFLIMIAAAFFALTSLRQIPGPTDLTGPGAPAPGGTRGRRPRGGGGGGFMNRLEQRWNRRREQNGQ